MPSEQMTLIQGGEFIVCENLTYTPSTPGTRVRLVRTPRGSMKEEPVDDPASIKATAALPINTMKAASVRIGDEIIPLPFIRSQERKVVSSRIRIDGPLAARIAKSLGLE
jgi:hypothetical protein